MSNTSLALELEITQEYLGYATHLVYLAPQFKECLEHDTYANGKGTTVAQIVEGKQNNSSLSVMAGVANIGTDINWCGHPFAQANWYAFGRVSWNPELSASTIADDWIRMTFTNNNRFVEPVKKMMMGSREAAVNYMMPLGLSHIMNLGTHYGPGPWDKITGWNAWDYHRSDSLGIGLERTPKGSNATAQYFAPLNTLYADLNSCPEIYLLWFHHVGWDYRMKSGKTLWNELVEHYYSGVEYVQQMRTTWDQVGPLIDEERFLAVKQLLAQQEREAIWWRDGCVLYFQTYSRRPIPQGLTKPQHSLAYYRSIAFPQ